MWHKVGFVFWPLAALALALLLGVTLAVTWGAPSSEEQFCKLKGNAWLNTGQYYKDHPICIERH